MGMGYNRVKVVKVVRMREEEWRLVIVVLDGFNDGCHGGVALFA